MFRPPSNDTPPRGGLFGHSDEKATGQQTYGLKQQQADLFGDSGAPAAQRGFISSDPLDYASREDLPPPGGDDIPTMFSSFPTKGTAAAGSSGRGLLDTSGIMQNRSGAYTADDAGFGPLASVGGSLGGLSSMGAGRSSGCWVTVFGFAPAMAVAVRHHIEAVLGEKVAECRVGNGNFMHVCLPSQAAARNCLQLSGSVFFEGTMIGIVPCTSPLINSEADEEANDVGYALPSPGDGRDSSTRRKSDRRTVTLAPQVEGLMAPVWQIMDWLFDV
ncbi:hypothetical protein FOZ61_006231 [Perkinsus olseni]|uniref:RRM Nup35-type domain-containing protein n=1 Tax=Perkinsus olseni TaxID=32597 RepID=A0A7J6LE48_PEROL|nr:hypothetical protein FOZ61_006231 [Perkinsus olseni]